MATTNHIKFGDGLTVTDLGGSVIQVDSVGATGPAGPAGAVALLSTTTLSSPGIFDVSGISGSYNDLLVIMILRSADAVAYDGVNVRFNNDSGSNYYEEVVRGDSTTASALTATGGSVALSNATVPGASAPANVFGFAEFTVYGYASTVWQKAVAYRSYGLSSVSAGFQRVNYGADLWASTAAVTRIQAYNRNSLGNFVTGSQMRIYGRL